MLISPFVGCKYHKTCQDRKAHMERAGATYWINDKCQFSDFNFG